jgi:hypothetical protein
MRTKPWSHEIASFSIPTMPEGAGAEAGCAGGAGMERLCARNELALASAPTKIVRTILANPRAILFASRGI